MWKNNNNNSSKAHEKVKRKVLCNDMEFGGLKMCNIKSFQAAFYLNWAELLIKNDEMHDHWKKIPLHNLKKIGGKACFDSIVSSSQFKGLSTIYSSFWKRVISIWLDYNRNNNSSPLLNQVIFNNLSIQYKDTLWMPNCIINNILRVRDVCINNRVLTFDEFKNKYPYLSNVRMTHNVIYNAISKNLHLGQTHADCTINTQFRGHIVGDIGRKKFLKLIQENEIPYVCSLWKRKLGVDIDKTHWMKAINSTKETRLRVLHWKIMNNIYPTNILLFKMSIKNSQNCEWCDEFDYIEHFFATCRLVKPLWKEIESQINVFIGKKIKLSIKNILLGVSTNDEISTKYIANINHAILIGKMVISKFKYGNAHNIKDTFEKEAKLRNLWKSYLQTNCIQ